MLSGADPMLDYAVELREVVRKAYRDALWSELIELLRQLNLHIARVMESVPKDERVRPRARHNLDEIAWTTVARDTPATLDYFMRD